MTPRIFLILFLFSSQLHADSVLLESVVQMTSTADYIAIVDFQDAERGTFMGLGKYPEQKDKKPKKFFRRVSLRVVDALKGKLPQEIQVYDQSGHWDALFQNHQNQSDSTHGRYLIFLTGDKSFLTGANGWASTARIAGDMIEWTDLPSAPDVRMVPLDNVLNRLKKQIERK